MFLQIFHFRVDQENRAHNMFPQEMIPQIFSNIKSIYQFHHDFLLPQLEVRMTNWDQEQKVGKHIIIHLKLQIYFQHIVCIAAYMWSSRWFIVLA